MIFSHPLFAAFVLFAAACALSFIICAVMTKSGNSDAALGFFAAGLSGLFLASLCSVAAFGLAAFVIFTAVFSALTAMMLLS